jgi:hypothetical protein
MFFSLCFSRFALCVYVFCVLCACFVATSREAPRGVVVSRHSSLRYYFWALLVVLFLGIHHYAIAFGCSSWCCCF